MFQPLSSVTLCGVALFCLFSCKNDTKPVETTSAPKPDTIEMKPVPTEGAATFTITQGAVNWVGKKAIGNGHEGTITVKSGTLTVNQNTILDGKITLDMQSIAVTDIKDAGERRDLESHLKDADFFEAEKFPEATFVIKEVLPNNNPAFNWLIVGDLTMKGKTNSVNIPVTVTFEGDQLRATSPTFPINRTQWGVNFRSGLLGTTRDKLIDDNVLLTLTLQAKKG
jgi:polyisoprenoid-binding protein YceI